MRKDKISLDLEQAIKTKRHYVEITAYHGNGGDASFLCSVRLSEWKRFLNGEPFHCSGYDWYEGERIHGSIASIDENTFFIELDDGGGDYVDYPDHIQAEEYVVFRKKRYYLKRG